MPSLAVIIPALNAAALLPACLDAVAGADTIVVVDGGSSDATLATAAAWRATLGATVVATLVESSKGRGPQMAAGAAAAQTEWLLFVHADTVLQPGWYDEASAFMAAPRNTMRAAAFRFALDEASPQALRLERLVAWRCRWLALPYGDQGLLISRALYEAVGGFRPLPIMEDVDIVRRIGRRRLVMLQSRAVTSAVRWRSEGWWRRSVRNLSCVALYGAGVPPRLIAKAYGA